MKIKSFLNLKIMKVLKALGLIKACRTYTKLLIKRPYPTKMITSGLIFGAADIIVQKAVEKKKHLSLYRIGCSVAVGSLYLAPWIHIWFEKGIPMIAKSVVSKKTLKNKKMRTFTYMFID